MRTLRRVGTVALILVAFYLLRETPEAPDPPPLPGTYGSEGKSFHVTLKLGEDGRFGLSWRDGLVEEEGNIEGTWEESGSFVTLRADPWSGPPPKTMSVMGLPGRKSAWLQPPPEALRVRDPGVTATGQVVSIFLHRIGP